MSQPDPMSVSTAPQGLPDVIELYGNLTDPQRIAYPAANAVHTLLNTIRQAKDHGKHIVLLDGAFDIPHDNHVWRLIDSRRIATERHYGAAYRTATPNEKRALIASDDIMFIVTLDADSRLTAIKGNRLDKGNIPRPVYTWTARANRIGGYMIPKDKGLFRPIVDIITVDGEAQYHGTPLESHLILGAYLCEHGLLDTWIVPSEHTDTTRTVQDIAGNALCIVPSGTVSDERTGSVWSTTYIIQRILGQ